MPSQALGGGSESVLHVTITVIRCHREAGAPRWAWKQQRGWGRVGGAKRGAAGGQCGEKQGAGSPGAGESLLTSWAWIWVRAGRGGPRTHAGKGEGAGAWRAAKASRGGMAGSSHSPGRWCGGGSGSEAAGRGQRSGQRGRGTGSGLSRPQLPAPLGPRAPGGGDWPPRWP